MPPVPRISGGARLCYRADDGFSFDYRRSRRLHLRVKTLAKGFGRVHLVPFSVNRFTALHLETDDREQRLHPIKDRA